MESEMKNFDDLFREEFSDYSEAPPSAVWPALEKRLDKDKKRRVFPLRWYWYFSILSFVTLLGASIAWKSARVNTDLAVAMPHTATGNTLAMNDTPTPVKAAEGNDVPASKPAHKTKSRRIAGHNTTGSTKEAAPKTTRSKRSSRHVKKANSHNYDQEVATNEVSREHAVVSANAPTVGTSIYSYDDFEKETVAEQSTRPGPTDAGSESTGEYVANKVKKHSMVAVDAVPVAEPAEPTTTNESSEQDMAAIAASRSEPGNVRHAATRAKEGDAGTPAVRKAATAVSGKRNADTKRVKDVNVTAAAVATASKPLSTPAHKKATPVATAAVQSSAKAKAAAVAARQEVRTTATVATKSNGINAVPAKSEEKKAMPRSANRVLASAATIKKPGTPGSISRPHTATGNELNTGSGKPNTVKQHVAAMPQVKEAAAKKSSTAPNRMVVSEAAGKPAAKKLGASAKASISAITENTVATKETVAPGNSTGKDKAAKRTPAKHEVVKSDSEPKQATVSASKDAKEAEPVVKSEEQHVAAKNGTQPASKKNEDKVAKHDISSVSAGKSAIQAEPNVTAAKPAAVPPVAAKPAASQPQPIVNKPAGKGNSMVPPVAVKEEKPKAEQPSQALVLQAAKKEEPKTSVASPNKETAAPAAAEVKPADTIKEEGVSNVMKLVLGIKGGFESGMSGHAGNKLAISPYIQYRISDKFSLMVQPAIKGARLSGRSIGNSSNYYEVNSGSGSYQLIDSSITINAVTGEMSMKRNYAYTETHDSIVKTNTIGGSYLEFELPLLLQYSLTPKLSVYGGVNTVFGRRLAIKENTETIRDISATGYTSTVLPLAAAPVLPGVTGITYSGTPLASYSGPSYPSDKTSLFRMGYMLGASYEFKKRWMADILVQQCFAKQNIQAGYNVNNALSKPYVRFTIGYRITK